MTYLRALASFLSVAVCLAVATSSCGSASGSRTSGASTDGTFDFVPVQPLTRDSFHAFVVAADARLPAPGTDPTREIAPAVAKDLFDELCGGGTSLLISTMSAYPSQAAAYEQVFDAVESQCNVSTLDRARGETAWNMTRNQLSVDKMMSPSRSAVTGFCGALQSTEDITSDVIACAAVHVGLVPESEKDLVSIAASFVIQACPQILESVVG